ncbi:DUF2771 domain-containing protein [Streptomyces sp. NPDC002851]
MTSLRMTAKGRRTAAALGVASAGLLVLTACGEKPTPLATVTIGTSTVSAEASCEPEGDAKALSQNQLQKCLQSAKSTSVNYAAGDTLRLGVEPEVVEGGKKWIAALDGNPITEPSNKTYRSFPNQDVFATGGQGEVQKSKKVNIIQVNESGTPSAVWSFKLKLAD